ncbi:MAG TPA: glycosyltransferase family 4 protein [Ilumatobacteraceae bacterium]|nr:glycosyltransferase family 4 protein [Ilumatobacteraceae bacterium]
MNDAGTNEELAELHELVGEIRAAGVRRVHVLAWRDLDDPDAGGSEVHADHFMRRWADAGLDVLHRTSAGLGIPATARRNGYDVVRRGSRYSVFPRTVVAELTRRMGRYDGLVEIWNGVPWFSPVWCHRPRITIVHHVHGPMWDQILPRPLAGLGRALETRLAPPFYRRTQVVTPSASTRDELLAIGFEPARVTAVDNGVEPFFTPGERRSDEPTIVATARLAPVKRFGLLIEAAAAARAAIPDLRVRIIGEGPERAVLERWIRHHDAASWVTIVGYVPHGQLASEYRRAWIVASASIAEGWGLALTEAAACGTPAVATDIPGHRSSVIDGVTGLLAAPEHLADRFVEVLGDPAVRERLGAAALRRARTLTWDASALGVTRVFHGVVTGGSPRRRAGLR